MDKNVWGRLRPTKRRLIQIYAALLYNANLKGFAEGELYTGQAKLACVPGLNCYSCPAAVGACPLGALQNALAASGKRPGFYVLGILLLFGLTMGRTICGWLCPVGLLQELLHKIPTPKIPKGKATRALSKLKYLMLVLFVIVLPLWFGLRHDLPLPAFCKYICPAGTLEGAVGLFAGEKNAGLFASLGGLFAQKYLILLLVSLACVFCYRSFCRFLCPLGAIYGLFAKLALAGVRVDADRCIGCGKCVQRCPMDIRRVGDSECIHCAQCLDACPTMAISLRAGQVVLLDAEKQEQGKRRKGGRLIAAAAILLLGAVLLWFNVPASTAGAAAEAGRPGGVPADFTVTCLDGTEFQLSQQRGSVVFLNLWATYCGPCVQEMPYFIELAERHPGDVSVLAVHSSLVTEDVEAFASAQGWELPIAVDPADDRVWNAVSGGSALPQTIVLDREGRVVYNEAGSVTPPLLESLYEQAAG